MEVTKAKKTQKINKIEQKWKVGFDFTNSETKSPVVSAVVDAIKHAIGKPKVRTKIILSTAVENLAAEGGFDLCDFLLVEYAMEIRATLWMANYAKSCIKVMQSRLDKERTSLLTVVCGLFLPPQNQANVSYSLACNILGVNCNSKYAQARVNNRIVFQQHTARGG